MQTCTCTVGLAPLPEALEFKIAIIPQISPPITHQPASQTAPGTDLACAYLQMCMYHTVCLDNLTDAFQGGACNMASSFNELTNAANLAACLHLVGLEMPRVHAYMHYHSMTLLPEVISVVCWPTLAKCLLPSSSSSAESHVLNASQILFGRVGYSESKQTDQDAKHKSSKL